MQYCAWIGASDLIAVLVEFGSDVNLAKKDGSTPLWLASQEGQMDAVKLLCQCGANVNTPNHIGQTPVYVASQNGHFEVIQILCEFGARVNSHTQHGYTPLMIAVHYGRAPVVNLLIRFGANIEETYKGQSALMIAVNCNRSEMVQMLIGEGANVFAFDQNGVSARDWAVRRGNKQIVKIIDCEMRRKCLQTFLLGTLEPRAQLCQTQSTKTNRPNSLVLMLPVDVLGMIAALALKQ
eukprot:c19641_g1_i6.p1 GENE.c19641_g1_i6~~c19641_g1_i6.p1  ORF type:complete len:237 (+),score=48.15 c19641_g1_i6:374-1084(+)